MNFTKDNLRLYAVTDRSWLRGQTLMQQVEQALLGGATLVQLREKELEESAFLQEAVEMTRLCHRFGVPLLINDNVEIARKKRRGRRTRRAGGYGSLGGARDFGLRHDRRGHGQDRGAGKVRAGRGRGLFGQRRGVRFVYQAQRKAHDEGNPARNLCGGAHPVVAIGGINREKRGRACGHGHSGHRRGFRHFAAEDIEQECKILRGIADQTVI